MFMKWLAATWIIGFLLLIWGAFVGDQHSGSKGFFDFAYLYCVIFHLSPVFMGDFCKEVNHIKWLRAAPRPGTISKQQLPIL